MSDETIAYLRADAAHWRARTEHLTRVLRDAISAAHDVDISPPEPPIGTVVHGDTAEFHRRADGWHCTRASCGHCPAGWDEVWDREASGSSVRVVLPGDGSVTLP